MMEKAKQYKWSDPGPRGSLRWLPLSTLRIDQEYQRREVVKEITSRPPTPPTPLCVKCGKPATTTFLRRTDDPNTEKVDTCGQCWDAAVDMHTRDDFTAGYNWLIGKDAPQTCATCVRRGTTACNPVTNPTDTDANCGNWCGDGAAPAPSLHFGQDGGLWAKDAPAERTPADAFREAMLRGTRYTHVPTPAAKPKGPTCWKCDRELGSFSYPASDESVAGVNARQLCPQCHDREMEWMRKQEILAALAANALDRSADREHAAWVRKQYQRAVDVPLVGTGGMGDTFDPRRRG